MNVDNLDISTNTDDVIIKGGKIDQLDIPKSIGDISVDSNYIGNIKTNCKFQRCPFNVGKPFFRWGYVILSQNKSDLVVF